jgi:hypothetical protein
MIDSLKKFVATATRKPVLSKKSKMTEPGESVDVTITFRVAPGVVYLIDRDRPGGAHTTPVSSNHDEEIGEAVVALIREVRKEHAMKE